MCPELAHRCSLAKVLASHPVPRVFGHISFRSDWELVKVDFRPSFSRLCSEDDYGSWDLASLQVGPCLGSAGPPGPRRLGEGAVAAWGCGPQFPPCRSGGPWPSCCQRDCRTGRTSQWTAVPSQRPSPCPHCRATAASWASRGASASGSRSPGASRGGPSPPRSWRVCASAATLTSSGEPCPPRVPGSWEATLAPSLATDCRQGLTSRCRPPQV